MKTNKSIKRPEASRQDQELSAQPIELGHSRFLLQLKNILSLSVRNRAHAFCLRKDKSSQGGYFLVKGYWGCASGWGDWGHIFHNWTDYNGVTFLVELLEWSCTFSGFLG